VSTRPDAQVATGRAELSASGVAEGAADPAVLLALAGRSEALDRAIVERLDAAASDQSAAALRELATGAELRVREPRELAARLQTILRRSRAAPADDLQALRFDGLSIDIARRQVQRLGHVVELTGTEFELLAMLAREPLRVFSRDEILNRLRGHEAELHTRAVDILVSRLRRKLEPLDCVKTLRNVGYAFAGARA